MNIRIALNALLVAAIAATVIGAVVLWAGNLDSTGEIIVTLPEPTATPISVAPAAIKVYVSGAVAHPGVYELGSDARVESAVYAAGGPAQRANLDRINLARHISDGEQIHVPFEGELQTDSNPSMTNESVIGKLDLNTATIEQLQSLPGIGAVRAEAIVEHRGANGSFEHADDLLDVPGIGEGVLGSIRNRIEVK